MRTDAELLRSYDPEAFGEFYERHVGAVTAYLGRYVHRQPDVLFDLLGETFARAYEHRRQHEPRKGPAIASLLSTARYVVAEAERRGQVPDTARKRIGMPPLLLGDTALAAITERGPAPTWPRRSPGCPSPSASRSSGGCWATTNTRRRPRRSRSRSSSRATRSAEGP